MRIPAGVELTNYYYMYVDILVVEGNFNTYNSSVGTSVKVTGTLNNYGYFGLGMQATGEGLLDHMIMCTENAVYSRSISLDSAIELAALCEEYAVIGPHFSAFVYASSEEKWVISENLTIPSNVRVTLMEPTEVVISAGATLTTNSWLNLDGPVVVEGTIVNNSGVVLRTEGSKVELKGNGKAEGYGIWRIWESDRSLLNNYLVNFDLSDYQATEIEMYDGSTAWELVSLAGKTKLGAPSELAWNRVYHPVYEGPDIVSWEYDTRMGEASWKTALPDQNRASIELYTEDGSFVTAHFWSFGSASHEEYRSINSFCADGLETGNYYFTVTSMADSADYVKSDTVKSPVWNYVKPERKVQPVVSMNWNWPEVSYVGPDDEYAGGYMVRFLHQETLNDEPEEIGSTWGYSFRKEDTDRIWDNIIQNNGEGYYSVQVKVLSSDITKAQNSDWSQISQPYHLTEAVQNMENTLDDMLNESEQMTPEEIRDNVQQLDTQDLKDALLADQNNSGATNTLLELEYAAGGPASVEVDPSVSEFNSNDISVVGANLNNKETESEGMTLVLDKPEEDHVIEELYNNSVAVSFSMNLNNVEDSKNLDVPVKITLPVPSTINPEFLVVLHYHVDGTYEELRPHIYKDNSNKYYATFVLTSFSDFCMTERVYNDPMRLKGKDRFATSRVVADTLKEELGIDKFDAVILVDGRDFADALAGSYLAAQKSAPILMVDKKKQGDFTEVKNYIADNMNSNGTVYILGGEVAVPTWVETELTGYNVKRLKGQNRYGTNLAILNEVGVTNEPILVCNAKNFADSLSASATGLPLLLVGSSLNAQQKEFLAAHTGNNIYVLGGTGAVSADVEEALKAYGTVERVKGSNRYGTSVEIAKKFFDTPDSIVLAYARNFPDGLAGGPLAYAMGAPLLLVDTDVNPAHDDFAVEYAQTKGINTGYVLGGSGLVKDQSVMDILGFVPTLK